MHTATPGWLNRAQALFSVETVAPAISPDKEAQYTFITSTMLCTVNFALHQ